MGKVPLMISRTTHPNYTPEAKARRAAGRARRAGDTGTIVFPGAREMVAKCFNQDNPALTDTTDTTDWKGT